MKGPLAGLAPEYAVVGHAVWRAIAPEIREHEFRSPYLMDVHFLYLLSVIRRRSGVPFRIRSDYRDPARNAAAGGASGSAHMERPCRAVDLHVIDNRERFLLLSAAMAAGIQRIGIYPAKEDNSGSVHLDASATKPQPRMWTRY